MINPGRLPSATPLAMATPRPRSSSVNSMMTHWSQRPPRGQSTATASSQAMRTKLPATNTLLSSKSMI